MQTLKDVLKFVKKLSGKLSRLKNKHTRNNVHASRLNANGSIEGQAWGKLTSYEGTLPAWFDHVQKSFS